MVKFPMSPKKNRRENRNAKSMGNGGMPTLMEKEIKDKYSF